MALATGLGSLANLGGGLISSGGQAAANAENVRMQNQMNQQMLNAQMASHEQNTAFMEDSQAHAIFSQDMAQRFNQGEAEKARQFASREATTARDTQMAFQERMAGTQYQRAMADMKAAGLNPILAYKMGGNAAPAGSGSMASGPAASGSPVGGGMASAQGAPHLSAPRVQNDRDMLGRALGSLVASAFDLMKTSSDIDLVKQKEAESREHIRRSGFETTKMDAETMRVHREIEKIASENLLIKQNTTNAKTYGAITNQELKDVLEHGSKYTPATLERILRTLQTTVEKDAGNIRIEKKEW